MGGNVFYGETISIERKNIENTIDNYIDDLSKIFRNKRDFFESFALVGSTGKKDISGDIDIAFDSSFLLEDISNNSIHEWGISEYAFKETYNKFKKRARTATDTQLKLRALLQQIVYIINIEYARTKRIKCNEKKVTAGNIFTKYPQFDENNNMLDTHVQVDWMIGNVEWLKFSYFSKEYEGNIKGLHRTQLLLSILKYHGYTFNHVDGVKSIINGDVVASSVDNLIILLNSILEITSNKKITENILLDYNKLTEFYRLYISDTEYWEIIDIYLRILDKTRCDIPIELQDFWVEKKEELGLEGKFLPNSSNLIGRF